MSTDDVTVILFQAPYLLELRNIRFLVLDEADRMVENGHFAELDNILALLPSRRAVDSEERKTKRQNRKDRKSKAKEDVEEGKKRKREDDNEESEEEAAAEEDGNDDEEEEEEEGPGSSLEEPEEDRDDDNEESDEEAEEEEEDQDVEEEEAEEDGQPKDDNVADLLAPLATPIAEGPKRQTFVLSATLTAQYKSFSAVSELIKRIEFQRKRHVVDLTSKQLTASLLSESKIECPMDEKDFYLTYFLREHPGRTIVFANSINSIRRLISILSRLRLPVYPLHAQLQQRQRLKNLDRFTRGDTTILVATDVAARGLDIKLVKHVVHYQLPQTAELYVHRSGRTARASEEGSSLALVSPEEKQKLISICRFLKKDDLPVFPVQRSLMPAIRKCVILSRKIDQKLHSADRKRANQQWVKTTSLEMDIDPEEDLVSDEETVQNLKSSAKRQAAEWSAQLNDLLNRWEVSKGALAPSAAVPLQSSSKKTKIPSISSSASAPSTEGDSKPKNRKELRREKQAAKRAKLEAEASKPPTPKPSSSSSSTSAIVIPIGHIPEMTSRARRDASDMMKAALAPKKKKKKFTKRKKGKGRR